MCPLLWSGQIAACSGGKVGVWEPAGRSYRVHSSFNTGHDLTALHYNSRKPLHRSQMPPCWARAHLLTDRLGRLSQARSLRGGLPGWRFGPWTRAALCRAGQNSDTRRESSWWSEVILLCIRNRSLTRERAPPQVRPVRCWVRSYPRRRDCSPPSTRLVPPPCSTSRPVLLKLIHVFNSQGSTTVRISAIVPAKATSPAVLRFRSHASHSLKIRSIDWRPTDDPAE